MAKPIPQQRQGFHPRTSERCPDCEYEERLDMLGRPRSNRLYGGWLTYGCETCGGTGRRTFTEPTRDLMDTGRGAETIKK